MGSAGVRPSKAWRSSEAAWSHLRTARKRRASQLLFDAPGGALPRSDDARRFWSQRTWSEFAAVPAVSQVVLALVRAGAPLETLGAYTAIADDEVRHAMLSRELAERFGGYVDEVPAGLEYAPRALADVNDVPVHVWGLANGCFSETVSLELIRARHAATKHPVIRAVLAETLKDEAVHVRVAWELAEQLWPKLPAAEKRELRAYGEALGQMLRRTFATSGLPARVRARERALRERTAALGLGSVGPDEEDQIVERTLMQIAARLG